MLLQVPINSKQYCPIPLCIPLLSLHVPLWQAHTFLMALVLVFPEYKTPTLYLQPIHSPCSHCLLPHPFPSLFKFHFSEASSDFPVQNYNLISFPFPTLTLFTFSHTLLSGYFFVIVVCLFHENERTIRAGIFSLPTDVC